MSSDFKGDFSSTTNSSIPGSHGISPSPCSVSPFAFETLCSHGHASVDKYTGAIGTPIVQAATFAHPSLGQSTGFDYARGPHPTRLELEMTVAQLEKGEFSLAFSSGMAAISCWLKRFSSGAKIVVSEDLYGGTWRVFSMYESYGIKAIYVDTSKLDEVKKALEGGADALFIETPSNPMMRISDIEACASLIHGVGGVLVVDNTFLTPYLQNPLELGADFVIHSATKYLGGHNDAVAGMLVYNGKENDEFFRAAQMAEGACLSPFDSFLILRGIKTLALRMKKAEENAKKIADFLCSSEAVEKVFYPGFSDSPGFSVNAKQARGSGAMISFRVKNAHKIPDILSSLNLILFAESLGGVQSLITYPETQTHVAIPVEMRERVGVDKNLLRMSVGIEDCDDLIKDLSSALSKAL